MFKILSLLLRLSRQVLYGLLLIGMTKQLQELLVLARRPLHVMPSAPSMLRDPYVPFTARLQDSKRGGPHEPHRGSPTASPRTSASTGSTSTTESPTTASGRPTPTSGLRTEGWPTPEPLIVHPSHSRTLSPTEASSTETGSPGSAPASSATGPDWTDFDNLEHSHGLLECCGPDCKAYYAAKKLMIELNGNKAVCAPGPGDGYGDCSKHDHVPGAHVGH